MSPLGPRAWLRCLCGEREAILALAASPVLFPAGALLALSAGFAREYDGAHLVREPWHVLLPLAASAVAATLFWGAFFRPWRGAAPSWRVFVGLFWMSAPLAWLYAIPYERFLAPLDAFHANLWTLALVSLWRVLWLTRVLAVLLSVAAWRTFAGVLFVADLIVGVAATLAPRPVMEFMGGVRGSPLEAAIGSANWTLLIASVLSLPVFGVAALWLGSFARWRMGAAGAVREGVPLLRFAQVAVLVLLLPLPWTQAEQARRWSVERDLRAGRISAALRTMSMHGPGDFPPGWDPPPHAYFRDDQPPIGAVLDMLLDEPGAPWVAERFVPKFFHVYHGDGEDALHVLDERLGSVAQVQGEARARALLELLVQHGHTLLPEQRQALERWRTAPGLER